MKGLKEFKFTFTLILSLIALLVFIGFVEAQKNNPSVPMKIAHQYRNDYVFEAALEWYEKVIKNFPNTQAAAEACLNRIAIFNSQVGIYSTLTMDFAYLALAQFEKSSNYTSSKLKLEALSEAANLEKKKDSYIVKGAQTGEKLREEFYRFEREYAHFIEKLPIPWFPFSEEEITLVVRDNIPLVVSRDNAEKILLLGQVSNLEFKSRIKGLMAIQFKIFCFVYMVLGGEFNALADNEFAVIKQWGSGKYAGNINQSGFYFGLCIGLSNSYQFKSAFSALDKVLALTVNTPYSKLRYEAEKKKKNLINTWEEHIVSLPPEAQEFVEKLSHKMK